MWNPFRKTRKEPPRLFFTTDIHCHILPAIDDGSPDLATSLELIGRMRSWGLERIVASPHVTDEVYLNEPATIEPALAAVNDALADAGDDFRVEYWAENRIDDLFLQRFADGALVAMPDRRILVENSFYMEPLGLDSLLYELRLKGYTPVMAHPERYGYYHNRFSRYEELHGRGLLFQCNILSFAGYYGKRERNVAEKLLERGMVDFVATDLHNHRHADAIEAFMSTKTYRRLANQMGRMR
ncbi:MAG: hypothetical protein NC336_04645 [Clostridium sp.]|nr:hypothetical protein [Clostridium sp.]